MPNAFDTLTQRKHPIEAPGRPLRVYVCGPTVYSYIHIGNARTFTSFDAVVRYLRYRGMEVRYVRNFTDVDDKIIQAAAESGESARELADRFIEAFHEDTRALGLIDPDVSPRVSEHIPEIVELIGKLIEKDVAYESQGDVYFAVDRWEGYAKLSRKPLDELQAGERVEQGDRKRAPLDFALWKAAKPGEPSWDSPWGKGRPGWHIECSAMAMRHLGETLDVHGGALDLIFPHHENEIAQSEAVTGKPFANTWMHCGFLNLEDAKMSKSLGNVVRLRDALAQVDGEALKLFFLSTSYRHPLTFSERTLLDAERRVAYFYETLQRADARLGGPPDANAAAAGSFEAAHPTEHVAELEAALDDDFNFPGALAAISSLFTELNEQLDRKTKGPAGKDVVARIRALRASTVRISEATGLLAELPSAWLDRQRLRAADRKGLDVADIDRRVEERVTARAERRFEDADAIRDALRDEGVELMDGPSGTTWKVLL